jgi:hypothetical protein
VGVVNLIFSNGRDNHPSGLIVKISWFLYLKRADLEIILAKDLIVYQFFFANILPRLQKSQGRVIT